MTSYRANVTNSLMHTDIGDLRSLAKEYKLSIQGSKKQLVQRLLNHRPAIQLAGGLGDDEQDVQNIDGSAEDDTSILDPLSGQKLPRIPNLHRSVPAQKSTNEQFEKLLDLPDNVLEHILEQLLRDPETKYDQIKALQTNEKLNRILNKILEDKLNSLYLAQKWLIKYGKNYTIKKLKTLKELYLNWNKNKIDDVSALKNLIKLEKLDLDNNKIVDISPLKNLTKLKILHLNNNKIVDINPLNTLTKLEKLDISNNQIVNINPLKTLTNLQTLYLSSNDIVDISLLEKLTNLQELGLSSNDIADISPLEKLIKLKILHLNDNNNKIVDISILEKLTNLQELDLSFNQIVDIIPLKDLTNLQKLWLHNNQIVDISPLKYLTNLQSLNLYNNQIVDYSPLNTLTNLSYIITRKTKLL